MNKRRKTVVATVTILYLLAVLVVPSFAFVSYNAAASIFWKSGVQGFYLSDNSNFLNGTLFEIPSSAFSSSNGVYFDTQYLSNYHNQYVDDGNFHFAYEILAFNQASQTPLMGSLSSFNHYLAFNRIMYVDPGVTVQFYVVPLTIQYRCSSDDLQSSYWFYTNLLSDVNLGSYDPSAQVNQFIDDQVLDYSISVVAQTVNNNNYPRNVYQITAKNNSSQTVTCTGVRFSFVPSHNVSNQPTTPNPNIELYQSKPYTIILSMHFSNVIQWFESVETDAVLNELAQIRAKQNRQIEIDEGIAASVSDVSSDVEEIKDYLAETADYSDVTAPPEYDPNIPESQAVARWDNYLNDAEDVLGQQDFRSSATFWQRSVTYLISLPGALTMSGLFAALLGLRAVLGR